eukprot:TRINITY_DN8980_c0_g1_i2.p1 TRINITY_DN8980_c0_g1~~TRINITY_DN8980_c0_g1_i2.p1  ORF type:complete len:244 (-),score=57.40 TRINITY_DN8980_c0_g1_i2:355-1086(-)
MAYRAIQCVKIQDDIDTAIESLSLGTITQKQLGPNEIRVDVHASSLNYFDLLMLVGRYQMKQNPPFVPGAECCGVVSEIGSKVRRYKLGDRVMIFMNQSCLAEEVVIAANLVLPLPDALSFEEGSGFGVGYTTAYHGLVQRGCLVEDEIVLVTGASGGMGIAAIQVAKALGAIVIAAASSEEKLAVARLVGADHTINYSSDNMKERVKEITNGRYVDVIYEIVGGDIFNQVIRTSVNYLNIVC